MNTRSLTNYLEKLNKFYDFAIQEQIPDINKLEQEQIDQFSEQEKGKPNFGFVYRTINLCRQVTFVQASEILWDANIWYLERFQFADSRKNPARSIKTISFIEILHKENRHLCQRYMKYCLGITHLAVKNIAAEYTILKNFLIWLQQEKAISVKNADSNIMEKYFRLLDSKNIKEGTIKN